jgi:hypothetical protein
MVGARWLAIEKAALAHPPHIKKPAIARAFLWFFTDYREIQKQERRFD